MAKQSKNKGIGQEEVHEEHRNPFSPKVVAQIADELAKSLIHSLPMMPHAPRRNGKKKKKIENGYFLDTSAIIDGRVFDVAALGLISGVIVITESILLELKHIADSQDVFRVLLGSLNNHLKWRKLWQYHHVNYLHQRQD